MGNRLSDETSPYLLQHAEQPVDWFAWGEAAFAEARDKDKPILLSVGYSACHWCHVMAHESFDDPETAALMNAGFVNVKVDREERPDVDRLYMRAVQQITRGGGGWPLTAFLTPDGEPFFGGTYFPAESRPGLPAFRDVLAQVREVWETRRHEIRETAESLRALLRPPTLSGARVLTPEWLDPVAQAARDAFDTRHGGLQGTPKFPPHNVLMALAAHYLRTHDDSTLRMFTRTLDGMARGGMYDLLAGGFARYSVDDAWRVPHFEKMLYDNAQLVPRYLEAWQLTGEARFARLVRETVGWALSEMRLSHGGFAASQDADSEGREGAYFVWTPRQIVDVLGEEEGPAVAALLQVTEQGTFEDGASVLRLSEPPEDLGRIDRARFVRARDALHQARSSRPAPARDDKVVVSWNALMISALAVSAGPLGEPAWLDFAIEAAELVLERCRGPARPDGAPGRLMRTYKDGRAHVPAYADDFANLLTACLDLWNATSDGRWLREAETLADRLVELFWDEDGGGGFVLLGNDQPPLVAPSKPFLSNAEPAPNGVAALAFVRLARLRDDPERQKVAEAVLRASQRYLPEAPLALGADLLAGSWLAHGGIEIAVIGERTQADTQALVREIERSPLPFAVRFVGADPDETGLAWLAGKTAIGGRATAYLCEGYACRLPVHTAEELHAQLDGVFDRTASLTSREQDRAKAPDLPVDPTRWIGLVEGAPPIPGGHVGVLFFWTACSINAQHTVPEISALRERYADRPVRVIGVHAAKFERERRRETVENAIERFGIRYPVLLDPDHEVWDAYGIRSRPTVVVIDQEHRVAALRSGETSADDLGDLIDALLGDGEAASELDAPRRAPATPVDTDDAVLRFPGRLHVWPDAFMQETGEMARRVYVADSGHHRIVEAELRLKGGWPLLVRLRTFGSGEAGFVDGSAETACFRAPQGLRRADETLYVADTGNHALRAIDLGTGEVRTLAGTGELGHGPVPRDRLATPLEVRLRSPWGLEVMRFRDEDLVFFTMAGSHQIWVYAGGHLGMHTGSGRTDHIDGPAAAAALAQPSDLALYGRYLLFVDSEVSSIRAVDLQAHQVVTVVGRGLFDFGDVDGSPDVARLQHPLALAFAGEEVFVADTYNHKIKRIALQNGYTRTMAGGEGKLDEPSGIARAGDFLLVTDRNHHRIVAVRIDDGVMREVGWA